MPAEINSRHAWTIYSAVPASGAELTRWLKIGQPGATPPEKNLMVSYAPDLSDPRYLVEAEPIVSTLFSAVYKAKDTRLNRLVAVKVLNHDLPNENDCNTLELEAKTMARIDHPHVVKVYDFTILNSPEADNLPAIIMEYVQAPTLRDILETNQKFSRLEIIGITRQLAETVDYMAQRKLFHRDLKPGNVFLTKDRIKICDFGISSWAMPQIRAWTEDFTAPEWFHNGKGTLQSEVFSLGAVVAALGQKFNELDPIILKAKAENPLNRYATAGEFAQAVEDVLSPLA